MKCKKLIQSMETFKIKMGKNGMICSQEKKCIFKWYGLRHYWRDIGANVQSGRINREKKINRVLVKFQTGQIIILDKTEDNRKKNKQ